MSSFFLVCYIISLALSLVTLLTGIFVGVKRIHTFRILPRALRLYLLTYCYPYFFVISIISFYISIFYLLYNYEKHLTVEIARNIITFSSQQIRNSFTFIIFERIIATIKLENYTMASKNKLLWIFTSLSYLTSVFYLGYNIYSKSLPEQPWLYNMVHYYAYSAHIFMLSACTILYLMNRRMYKLYAYRITLKRRYTIAQNIKSLKYLFPTILTYALFAQFGSMITIIFQTLNLPTPPVCIFHIFFNLSSLLIYLRHYWIHSDKIVTSNIPEIKNPLGKKILINVTTEQYFQDLKNQWK